MIKIKYLLARILNRCIIKKKNSIFFEPHHNSKAEKQDIINSAGDSVLEFLKYIISNKLLRNCNICLVIYEKERAKIIKKWLVEHGYGNVKLIYYINKKSVRDIMNYTINKMRYKVWICASVEQNKKYCIKSQKLVCLGYFISFKSDYSSNSYDYNYLPDKWELITSSSMFDSIVKSAAFHLPYNAFAPLGLARNDTLFKNEKKDIIIDWIYKKTGRYYKKIILYAPTFRDYENNSDCVKRNIWGYSDDSKINNVLKENDTIVIAKLHSWQNTRVIDINSPNVLLFETNYSFTAYDIMSLVDVVITDYSSIGIDFLLTNKPIIYNLYDLEKYIKARGLCLEPHSEIFAGDIVSNEEELAISIAKCLNNRFDYSKYNRVKSLFLNFQDANACKRIYSYIIEKGIL